MSDAQKHSFQLPPEQQAIRNKCFHPSGTFVEFPMEDVETSIPARFEKIVRMYPDRLAIKKGNRALTYDQLNKEANRIAWAILESCGKRSEPIALLFDHDIEVVCAILGVLKAGKFYIALDPSAPLQRLAYILDETECRWIVTHERKSYLVRQLRGNTRATLNIDELPNSLPFEEPKIAVSPDDLSTITYTSGSTGNPKGVIETHRCRLHNVMVFTNGQNHICAADRLSLVHSVSFASGEIHLYGTLLNGAALFPFDLRSDGIKRLASWLREEKITVCHLSVAVFSELANLLTHDCSFPELRIVHLSGSPITRKHFELYRQVFASDSFLGLHMGTTETLVISTAVVDAKFKFPNKGTLLGYPAPDKHVVLLDDAGKEVGRGEVGEIVVKSRYMPRGYWRRSQPERDRYFPDPAGGAERTYMTGDLGRILPDGFMIHLGRKDHMVKIRGYRVNIGEAESALAEFAKVKNAAVVARDLGRGEMSLVGYLVSSVSLPPTVNEINKFLRTRIPDYMIPSNYVFLDSLPLVNGKVDRARLPVPELKRPRLAESYVAPDSLNERMLERIWAEALGLDCVGIHDNFFDLGGHSLSGSRLVSLIHKEFKFDLPVSEFFAAPTIAELTRRIERAGKENPGPGKKAWTYLCELQRGEGRKPVFIFPGGGGGEPEFFVYGFLARHVGTEYPFYGLRARGADGILQPHTSVAQMADAYVEEIRAIQPEGPYFLVGECAGGVIAYEAARQLLAQGHEVAMLVLMDVERPQLTEYLRFRAGQCLRAATKFWTRRRWRENYYLAGIPFHLKQLRSLGLNHYPEYFLGRLSNAIKPTERQPNLVDSSDQRASVVLQAGASGQALQHIEWVRENYRRTVRRFHPKLYAGHIEIIVNEKLNRRDPTMGWKTLALEGLRIHPVNGDHWSYIREHVAVAGLKLRECLERAEKERTSCEPT